VNASGIRKLIRQGAHPGRESIPAPVLRKLHVQDLDRKLVARHRAVNRNRAGEKMRPFAGRHALKYVAMLG
jgi:hypothetical protein